MVSWFNILRSNIKRNLRYILKPNITSRTYVCIPLFFVTFGGGVVCYTLYQSNLLNRVHAKDKEVYLTPKNHRFNRFASVEYNGKFYMTPRDFLESITEQNARVETYMYRKVLTDRDMEIMKKSVPNIAHGSPRLFRDMEDRGIISYNEYLFLLSILSKPNAGFLIAFNMFDTHSKHRIGKEEYSVIENIFSEKKRSNNEATDVTDLKTNPEVRNADTTLKIHFFGISGNETLRYEVFENFMKNVQTEVLEIEFRKFSHGFETISVVNFAKILLRYTNLDPKQLKVHLDRLAQRIRNLKDITFRDFYLFSQFLNNLEDFSAALLLYSLSNHPISKSEFNRVVKICTGTSFSENLVETIFAIFDNENDGLSYDEFISVMKKRSSRRIEPEKGVWRSFRACIKKEFRNYVTQ